MGQVYNFADFVYACVVIQLIKRLVFLYNGLNVVYGHVEFTVKFRCGFNKYCVVRYKHRVRIIIASVKSLLYIFIYGIYAKRELNNLYVKMQLNLFTLRRKYAISSVKLM